VIRLRRPQGGLWHHPDFLRLWAGQSISELGSQVSLLAIPLLAAVQLHARPIEFSLLGVAGFAPFILFALPAGAWVDRLRRRRILIAGDAVRAVLLALIPVLWATHTLQMWHLLVIQFAVGVFTVFFDVAYQAYLPALIDREQLVDGNAKLQLTVSVAQVAGPSTAGALVAAITAPYAIVADAASFLVSTAFMLRMRHRESMPEMTPETQRRRLMAEAMEGLRWVVGHRWLRAIAACTSTANFFSNLVFAILVLYMVRELRLTSLQIGAVFALGACGSIAGALAAGRLQRRLGVGRTIVAGALCFAVAGLPYPLAPHAFPMPLLILGGASGGFGSVVYNITQVSLRQAITPERLQGRMNAGIRWIVWGTIPLGALAGGIIAQAYGLKAALWIGALGSLLGFLPVALTSVRSVREIPAPVETPTATQAEMQGGIEDTTPPAVAISSDA